MMPPKDQVLNTVASLASRVTNLMVDGTLVLGIETKDGILNATATAARLGLDAPRDVDDMLQRNLGGEVQQALDAIAQRPDAAVHVAGENMQYAPIVTRPDKVICVGFNYRDHAIEADAAVTQQPPLFAKYRNTLSAHEGSVYLPMQLDQCFDYETELVIVFGRGGHNIAEEDALDYVAGYTIGIDLSARTLQRGTSQFLAGKTINGFAPVGPWLAPCSIVRDAQNLRLQTRVNGQLRQDGTTRDMIFDCKKLISFVSSIMNICPGDVLFTGTPDGVILGEKAPSHQRRWLRPGDRIESHIDGLGRLRIMLDGETSYQEPTETMLGASARQLATVDRMSVLTGGEAHVKDISQWSPGINVGEPRVFSNHIYLIQHGCSYLVWDTGVPDSYAEHEAGQVAEHSITGVVKRTVLSQFEELGLQPAGVTHVAFSHGHFDHIGNSQYFRNATWLVQEDEFNVMFGDNCEQLGYVRELYDTMKDNRVIIVGDEYDVFGDGSVVIFRTAGHTPGHQSLLVRLKDRGPVILSGDVAHFRENFDSRRVPYMNSSRQESLKSMDKVQSVADAENAELWINHDLAQSKTIPHAPHWIT